MIIKERERERERDVHRSGRSGLVQSFVIVFFFYNSVVNDLFSIRLGFYPVSCRLIALYRGFTGFYWVLLDSSGFHWVLLGFTGFYRVLTGFY